MKRKLFALATALALVSNVRADETADEVFAGARWLWPAELGSPTNVVVEFRQTFDSAEASSGTLSLAADTVYFATLNGKPVYTGRFPDIPPRRFYDRHAVTLNRGANELIISLYVQGIDSFQHLPGDPGLMYALEAPGCRVTSGEKAFWRLSTADRAEGVPLVSTQLGFSFEYDARTPPADWRKIRSGDATRNARDFLLRERPVPRVKIQPACPATIVGMGLLDGTPTAPRPAAGMDAVKLQPVEAGDFFASDGASVRPENFARGFYITLDLGREECGFLTLDVDTDEGTVLDIGHAEHMTDGRIRTAIGNRNFAGRYHARAGRQKFCRWEHRMAGRYLQVHVRGARTHFTLNRLSVLPVEPQVVERPMPALASDLERDIYRTSVRTLKLCLHEHYEDCPWREQALYGNDSRNQMLAGYLCFADDGKMPELALELLARGLGDDGWIELCMPAKIWITIPSFSFCWALSVDDNRRYRQSTAFTRQMMPFLRRLLGRRIEELRDGLLPCPKGSRYWQFYEWKPGLDGSRKLKADEVRYDAGLNLFFILALEAGARCAEATQDVGTSVRWREIAARTRASVRARFWNAAAGQVETTVGVHAVGAEFIQSLALLTDVVPAEARAAVVRKLSAPSDWTEISLSQALYKYEALIAAGPESAALARQSMNAIWGEMLKAGATSFWEVREGAKAFNEAGSLCHGWSAIPICIYDRLSR